MSNEIKVVLSDVNKIITKVNWLSSNDYTTVEKNKVSNLPDDTNAQLAEKVQNFKIKNEVVNGNFASGAANWTGFVNFADMGDYVKNDSYRIYRTDLEHIPLVNKVYARAKVRVKNTDSLVRLLFTGFDFAGKTNPVVDTWYDLSGIQIGTRTSKIFQISAGMPTTKIDIWKGIVLVDLTTIFGVGNEPTKLEMDELIKVIPNQWWEGELSLTQKQFITWQLNLIRKNTNAIIALGGTIV